MNVNSAISAVQLGGLSQSQPAARPQEQEQQPQAIQESSVVKLSTRAIQLSQAETRNQEAGETASREAAEPAPVQRTESGASRSIDTYA
jgi:hypothetical protein